MSTEQLMVQLLEKAKTDKPTLIALKASAVKAQQYELASNLREIERELFPETKEQSLEIKKAGELNLLFRMVDLNIDHATCWLIAAALEVYKRRKNRFDTADAAKVVAERNKLFGE